MHTCESAALTQACALPNSALTAQEAPSLLLLLDALPLLLLLLLSPSCLIMRSGDEPVGLRRSGMNRLCSELRLLPMTLLFSAAVKASESQLIRP